MHSRTERVIAHTSCPECSQALQIELTHARAAAAVQPSATPSDLAAYIRASRRLRIEITEADGGLFMVQSWIGAQIDSSYVPLSLRRVLENVLPTLVAEWRNAHAQSDAAVVAGKQEGRHA